MAKQYTKVWEAHHEDGDLSEWAENGGTGSSESSGSVSAQLTSGGVGSISGDYTVLAMVSSGSGNKFARTQLNIEYGEGDKVSFGCWFYLPSGFKAAMQGEVQILRWDCFPVEDRGGIAIDHNDKKVRVRYNTGEFGSTTGFLSGLDTGWDIPEGEWFHIRLDYTLSETEPLTELYINGVKVGESTDQNYFGQPVTRIRAGIVSINSNTQTNALTIYFDDADVSEFTKVEPVSLRRNLFPFPSFEMSSISGGYTQHNEYGTDKGLGLSTDWASSGEKSLHWWGTGSGTNAVWVRFPRLSPFPPAAPQVQSNKTYTVSLDIRVDVLPPKDPYLEIIWSKENKTVGYSREVIQLQEGVQRISLTVTSPADTIDWAAIEFGWHDTNVLGDNPFDFYFDSILFIEGTETNYFDGSGYTDPDTGLWTPDPFHERVAWEGQEHLSPSVMYVFDDPPAPPTAVTGEAQDVTHNSAILHGTVNPNGSLTIAHFEWGTTTEYEITGPPINVGDGESPIPIEQSVGSLNPKTEYHFRVVAANDGGQVEGDDKTFETAAPPGHPIQMRVNGEFVEAVARVRVGGEWVPASIPEGEE